MEFSLGDLLTLGAVVAAGGAALNTISGLKQRVRRIESGQVAQGQRIGDLDKTVAVIDDRVGGRPRRQTAAVLVPVTDETSGSDER